MADEQFTWLDYPSPHVSQKPPRVGENSNSQWRSPFYNTSSSSSLQTPLNNNSNTQPQYYPSYQQQEESYVRLEDVLPYTSYRWRPPPTREGYQRQTSYPDSNSGLPLPTTSLPHQSPKRPTAPNRQLPAPMPQVSGESSLANDVYTGHEAKRRRIDPVVSQATPQIPKIASPVYSQVLTQPAAQKNSQYTSQYNYSAPSNTSQTTNSIGQTTVQQATAQRSFQQAPRAGSQFVSPAQSRTTPQAPQRTASPATSQVPAPRTSQYASQGQSQSVSRASSSASPQTTAQQTVQRRSQHASPKASAQATPQSIAPPALQNHQNMSQPNSQCNSPATAAQSLPQTVTPSDTQTRPPQISHPYSSSQTRPQGLPPNARQPASQSSTQSTSQLKAKPSPKPASQPAARSNAQPISLAPQSTSVPRQPTQSTAPHIQHNVHPQRPSSTHTAPPAPAPKPQQTPSQMPQTQHTQPAHGSQGSFAVYASKPDNHTDRTYLKRRPDIVSRFNEADAAKKLTYDPKTIARDVLIAASRHPTESTLNHHLFRLQDIFTHVDMTSDLETFRWDLVDPGEPSREFKAQTAAEASTMQTSQTAPPPAVQVPVNISAPQPAVPQQHRPPQPFHQVQLTPPPQQQPQPQPQPQIQIQIQAQPQPAASPVSRSSFGAQTPNTPNTMEKKRRGRPPGSTNKPKVAALPPAVQAPTASFPVFACRWLNCQAELHNLEALKRHLFKVHVSQQLTCGWRGCSFTGTLPAAVLMKHVKKEHLDSLAWKLGDGPTVPTSVDPGKTATVTIPTHQPGNEDSLIFPAEYRSIRAFHKVHGNNSQQEKAREIFKAVQRLKEHIGVGLDPGGCELASPLRNQRVSDEEDVYEVRPIS
ncbi:putative C2H2 finger domain protein [Aspergillus undulatus]|uniref:putative C2H2 finger domain protein n=1 Tax=Aspergillus undulatus TaxID=1810928 RepID=UPI003CCDDB38